MLLVTGGAGFIGSNVVAALNEAGRTDVAVCDLLGCEGKGPAARCPHSSRRDLGNHGDRRRSRDRNQFPPVALEAVDLVAIFSEDTPVKLITQIKPSVLVKGGDYTREQVVGHEIVEAGGGAVMLVEILPGLSTTLLVNRAKGEKA